MRREEKETEQPDWLSGHREGSAPFPSYCCSAKKTWSHPWHGLAQPWEELSPLQAASPNSCRLC